MNYTLKRLALIYVLFFLFSSCKKNKPSLNEKLSYTVTDTTGKTYSFTDFVSLITENSGVTMYCFDGNNNNCQLMPDAYISYDKSTTGDYTFSFIIESSYFSDPQNGINLPQNAVYMDLAALQNTNTQFVSDARHSVSLRLNNISQMEFQTATINTSCSQNSDGSVSGTFNIAGYTGTGMNHYTISGQFTKAIFNTF